jgi:hypothetical protein
VSRGTGTVVVPARAHASGPVRQAVAEVTDALVHGLGSEEPAAVLYFASSRYDPTEIAGPMAEAFPDAVTIGCSTAGEFTDTVTGTNGISAIALPFGILTGALAALGDLDGDVTKGMWSAVHELEDCLEIPLRDLDPSCHLGFVLIDGLSLAEEKVNEVLGNAAPVLDIVGGSAGDDLAFDHTWVAVGHKISYHGAALLVCQTAVPFHVMKTCSFTPTGRVLRITEADVATRTVLSFDGRTAADVYAEAVGVRRDALDDSVWMSHPVGLMINGQPWIRSPQAVTPEGHVVFYAQILPGMEVEVMEATDMVADTRNAVTEARTALGDQVSGAVLFNCILRRLEMDAKRMGTPFLESFDGLPLAGFHTYGETWLGHVNQTLTGVVFG